MRAVSAARISVLRSSEDPALLIGWPLRSVFPVRRAGARPVKALNAAAVANHGGRPITATSTGPPTVARPGRVRARPPISVYR